MGKQNERTQREFHLFSRFCQAAKIPLYPITPIIIGLCKVAKDGAGAPPRSQLDRTLEKLADLEKNLFKNKPEYIKLCELGDELVGREDDDSSIATLDNTDHEEALSTDAQTDVDTDSSEGICTSSHGACALGDRLPLTRLSIPCHSRPEGQLLQGPGVTQTVRWRQFATAATRGQGSGESDLLQLLPSDQVLTHLCSHSATHACRRMGKSLARTPRQKSHARWLFFRAMAFEFREIPMPRPTAEFSAVAATGARETPNPANSPSSLIAERTGLGSRTRPNRRSSTITNPILADWRIPLGSPRSTRRTSVERSDSESSNRVRRGSVRPRGRCPSTSTRTHRLQTPPKRILRLFCRTGGVPPGRQRRGKQSRRRR